MNINLQIYSQWLHVWFDIWFFVMLKVLNQEETPLLYSLVFGEGVVNDATSIVLFNAVQSLDFSNFNTVMALKLFGTFLYLFVTSTALGITVSLQVISHLISSLVGITSLFTNLRVSHRNHRFNFHHLIKFWFRSLMPTWPGPRRNYWDLLITTITDKKEIKARSKLTIMA